MRKRARTDRNQEEIVIALRRAGATVQILSGVHDGCPDLLVGHNLKNYLLEVKDGNAAPSRQRLTPEEDEWICGWSGQVSVVNSITAAFRVLGL
jgi:hypothetical protein